MTNIGWNFDNSYSRLSDEFYSKVNPSPVTSPTLVIFNDSLAHSLGINVEAMKSEQGVEVLAGNKIPEGAEPLAQAYAGHQFGHFTMLGDGRAILLGEQITPEGERFDIQWKGPGRTPFSRGGDGRAALGPMLREYIISEAMHALNIPTTRSLAVVATGEDVVRERYLPGAILTRVASSHIRVGTFQYAAAFKMMEDVKELADYTIDRHYPEVKKAENKYLSFLESVINRQADLVAKWQLVGFIHGVMNTDNMTISGETIDYGPCAFMDTYSQNTVFSSIDREGRYAYGNQPYMAVWNLARFAETLVPLLHESQEEAVKLAESALSNFAKLFEQYWLTGMRAKLGLFNIEEQDNTLIKELLEIMEKNNADFTNTFRSLTLGNTDLAGIPSFDEWYKKWELRLGRQEQTKEDVQQLMKKHNPFVIPRNHRVEEALEAAEDDDFTVMERLLEVLSNPFEYKTEHVEYCQLPPEDDQPYRTFCGT